MTNEEREELRRKTEALKELLKFAEKHICLHESTHRGGAIWEICDDCGMKWADDEGGMPDNARDLPEVIQRAYEVLNPPQEFEEVEVVRYGIYRKRDHVYVDSRGTEKEAIDACIDGQWYYLLLKGIDRRPIKPKVKRRVILGKAGSARPLPLNSVPRHADIEAVWEE